MPGPHGNRPVEREEISLDPALGHAAAMFQGKIGELSLVRELSDCGTYLTDPETLACAITGAIRSHLNVDACALFNSDSNGWRFSGGTSLDPVEVPPETIADNLLDMASEAPDGIAMTGVENENGMPQQVAVSLCQGHEQVGALVLTDIEAGRIWAERQDVLAIITRLVTTLVAAARMYHRVEDSNRYLEATLAERTQHLKETQERLHQQEKLASLGQLVTGVSHELNNRLVPILGYAQLLREERLEGQAGKAIGAIEVAALGSKRIVDDLLSFARPSDPNQTRVDLVSLLEEVKEAVSVGCEAHCPVTVMAAGEVPPVTVDPHQTEQLFHNLVKNALEALEGRDDGHVRVGVQCIDDRIQVTVEDNGSGMPEEVQARIFEPFFSTKGVGKGTGLGLSITHGLVQANGGTIRVASRNGFGSRFTVSFPASVAEERPDSTSFTSKPSAKKHKVSLDISRSNKLIQKKILVVDDESGIREFLSQALNREFVVSTAENGLDAQCQLEKEDFDLVLMDMRMPGQGGIALYRWISANRPETAPNVIFMTGDLYDQEANAFLCAQGNTHLLKPFTLKELKKALRATVEAT